MTNPSKIDAAASTPVDPAASAPPAPEDIAFDDLIAPLTREEFFADYWEQKPFVSRGRSGDFYRNLFSTRDVDDFIVHHRPKPGHLDLVSNHGFVRDNFLNADQTANINLVYQSYLKGSTVILSGLESSWTPLNVFCRKLEGDLSFPVGVAVYLTPPNTKGVKPHFDTQEGFLVQVDGSKRWLVYKPILEFPPVEGSYTSVEPEQLSEPILDTVLHPGDVLYMPRGFPHEGSSCDGDASLHITLEVHVRSWFDLISDTLGALADRDMRFRRSVPVGFLNDDAAMQALSEDFAVFKDILHRDGTLEDAVRKHVEHLAVDRPPIPDGHFSALFAKIEPDTPLKKRRITTARLFEENGMAGMQFSGNHIAGPAKIRPALEFIRTADAFTPADLPGGLSGKEQLVLANRLVKIGLLTLA